MERRVVREKYRHIQLVIVTIVIRGTIIKTAKVRGGTMADLTT